MSSGGRRPDHISVPGKPRKVIDKLGVNACGWRGGLDRHNQEGRMTGLGIRLVMLAFLFGTLASPAVMPAFGAGGGG
jgi:hypothetical protein